MCWTDRMSPVTLLEVALAAILSLTLQMQRGQGRCVRARRGRLVRTLHTDDSSCAGLGYYGRFQRALAQGLRGKWSHRRVWPVVGSGARPPDPGSGSYVQDELAAGTARLAAGVRLTGAAEWKHVLDLYFHIAGVD